MMKVSVMRRAKAPPTLTRVLLLTACTLPPCGHIMTLAVFSSAGIT
jgi:hypothetical protein